MSWHRVTCEMREAVIDALGRSYNGFSEESGIGPLSSRTDMHGEYGFPYVMTKWGRRTDDLPVLWDERWPDSDRPCEHHIWAGEVAA